MFTWDHTTGSELDRCLEIDRASNGAALVGANRARALWHELLHHPAAISACFRRGAEVVGFAASYFVRPQFLDGELSHPRPDVNSRLFAKIDAGENPLLTRAEIGRENADDGLDVWILVMTAIEAVRGDPEFLTAIPTAFVEFHLGYRLRRIAYESVGPWITEVARRSNYYASMASFPDLDRELWLNKRAESWESAIGLVNQVYLYTAPVLKLREAHQDLLSLALQGADDESAARSLHISLDAVRARWKAIHDQVWSVKPEIFSTAEPGSARGRGGQKRHLVLNYVRKHPEELRPYAWQP